MSPPDLFELAKGNSPRLEQQWSELLGGLSDKDRSRVLAFFEEVATRGRVAINLEQSKLGIFLSSGEYLNVHAIARREAGEDEAKRDKVLRRELKGYYPRRTSFDGSFQYGENFLYGSLSIGGLGALKYKDHCMVLKPFDGENHSTAYLSSDSLKTDSFWNCPDPNDHSQDSPNLEAISYQLADTDHRSHLAGIKHGGDPALLDQSEWAGLLSNGRDYIEVIFTGGLAPLQVEAVRMPKSVHDRLFRSLPLLEAGALPSDEGYRVKTFRDILVLMRGNGIRLELIDD